MLLIHPPQTKCAEPPAGIPMLAGALRGAGADCTVADLNVECLHYLLELDQTASDTWSKRAWKNRHRNIEALQYGATYSNHSRYTRAINDLNRVLENAGKAKGLHLTLSNYQDLALSPLKSSDLKKSARAYRENIYFPLFSKRLQELISTSRPEYIGISLNYLSQALCTFAIIGYLRENYPAIKIILGGGLVTTWMQNNHGLPLLEGIADHSVSGPGISPLFEILGLTQQIPQASCPDFSDLTHHTYLSPGFVLPYSCSSGCFWRKCSFCPETSEKNPYLPLPADRIHSDLNNLAVKTSPKLIHLLDNAVSPAILRSFTQAPLPAPWYGFIRFTRELIDPEFCKELRRSGCVMLKLGLESGNRNVLEAMHKGIDLQLAATGLKNLHDAGIQTYVYLLFGTPGENEERARDTMLFVSDHHEHIDYLNLAIFNMPVGSDETGAVAVTDFYEGDLSIYRDFVHPEGWDRISIRRFLDSEFRKQPNIKQILQRDPPHFTSNHAPFFHPEFT